MISVSCDGISLSFGPDDVLKDVSFALNEGEKLGVVGVNGAGKSTLLGIIAGTVTDHGGSVSVSKDMTVGLLSQTALPNGDRTVLEEAFSAFGELVKREKELEELKKLAESDEKAAVRFAAEHEKFVADGGYAFRNRAKGILRGLGLPDETWDCPVSVLSGGQKTRLALSCLLMRDDDVLLLDEPTNHLDTDALFWLEDMLRRSKKTVIAVSHDRYFLDSVCGKILEIEHGRGRVYAGGYTKYLEKKKTDREIAQRHYDNQQKEIRRQQEYIEQQRRWNRERNIIAAESRQKLLDKMVLEEKPESLPAAVRMSFGVSVRSGEDVLVAEKLEKTFPGRKKPLFSDLSFRIKLGDRLFFTGENGCGKSTLLRIIAGKIPADRGYTVRGTNVSIGYYDQENRGFVPDETVLGTVWSQFPKMTETEVRSALALFLFRGDDVFKNVGVLSGGEKSRLTLLVLMMRKSNLLIPDEPTNNLDIPSREALEDALENFDGTLIAVSHDRYFLKKLSTRIIYFGKSDGRADFCPVETDGFDGYLSEMEKKSGAKDAQVPAPSAEKERWQNAKRDRSEMRKKERRLATAAGRAAEIEKRITEINGEMSGPAAFDHLRLTELSEELESLESELLEQYEILDGNDGF